MEIYNDRLCLTGEEVWAVLGSNFNTLLSRGQIKNLLGRACYNRCALYDVDEFPNNKKNKYRDELYSAYPELSDWKKIHDVKEYNHALLNNIVPDANARKFFAEFTNEKGDTFKPERQKELENSAIILNAMWRTYNNSYSAHARAGNASKFRKGETWQKLAKMMPVIAEKYVNCLPFYWSRLQDVAEDYAENSYAALLSGKLGNKNRTVVTPKIENLVLSIYATKDKPFVTEVLATYNEFLLGIIDIVDRETGAIYDRRDFYKNGEAITLSEATIWKILNAPKNRRIVDARRNDSSYNRKTHEPHTDRKSPEFSFSKITMDDRDLTRKTTSGEKVFAYYSYDVASGCVIGASYSKDKDADLVTDCFRDMFRFIGKNDFNMPAEVEVEHHLMNKITDELNAVFPIVYFCPAGVSQGKRAEHLNRAKKYGAEKKLKQTTGRWWARSEAYLQRSERAGAEYKEKKLPYRQLVAEDLEAIAMYNNEMHPNQRKYPGMKRIDVLTSCQNPKLGKMNKPVAYRYFGYSQQTSLKRTKSATVQYKEWWLPTPELIDRFKSNNYECTAYYLPDADGNIESVFLYQGDRFIAECKEVGRFNEAKIERTEEDEAVMLEQLKYISQYRRMVKDGKEEKLTCLEIVPVERTERALETVVEIIPLPPPEQVPELVEDYGGYDAEDWAAKALNSM